LGVHHIVRFPKNAGLAKAFLAGLERGLAEGADIIVNTDADNQYCAADIPKLIQPVIDGKADIVIGSRPITEIETFSGIKKLLQKLGSFVVRLASGTTIPDAPSGFRAISRKAAMQLNVFSEYTYTLETIIQSGQKGIAITSVPIRTNPMMRPSRLVKSIPSYVRRSMTTIFRIFMTYRPLRFFASIGMMIFAVGFAIGLRFLYFYFNEGGAGHIQSLILAALCLGTGFSLVIIGLVADLISVNRKLLEKNMWHLQQIREHLDRKR
jgi:glycosyltransferase involved in cell wall biosynthesis